MGGGGGERGSLAGEFGFLLGSVGSLRAICHRRNTNLWKCDALVTVAADDDLQVQFLVLFPLSVIKWKSVGAFHWSDQKLARE